MKETAREKAIEVMRRTFNDAERLTEQSAGDLVDALIEAVRAPESAYTRDVQRELQKLHDDNDAADRRGNVGPANT